MYLREKDNDEIPTPTPLENVLTEPGEVVQLIVAVMPDVRREHSQKAVEKTLAIPVWMEDELKNIPTSTSLCFCKTRSAKSRACRDERQTSATPCGGRRSRRP